jgi:hypothetical protein
MIHPGLNVSPLGREMIVIILTMNKMNQWKRLPEQGKLSISRRKNPVSGVKVRMTTGPDHRMKIGPDFQMTVGPDHRMTAGPDHLMKVDPDFQMTAGPDHLMKVDPDFQMTAGTDQIRKAKSEHSKRNQKIVLRMNFQTLLTSSREGKRHQVLIRRSHIAVHAMVDLLIGPLGPTNHSNHQEVVVSRVIGALNSEAQRVGALVEKGDSRNFR